MNRRDMLKAGLAAGAVGLAPRFAAAEANFSPVPKGWRTFVLTTKVEPTFARMLAAELWLSFLYASYNGAMVVALTEVMPVSVRTAGFSLAYSLATAIFGGFTPAVSTWLIQLTGDKAAPGYWMSAAAASGLVATMLLYRGIVRARD